MRLYLDVQEAEEAVARVLAEPHRNKEPWQEDEVRSMAATLAGCEDWQALVEALERDDGPDTSRPAIGGRFDKMRDALGHTRFMPSIDMFYPPDHPERAVDPHVRFSGKALEELQRHGWRQEDEDVIVQRRSWTVLSKPHPAGGVTRLMTIEHNPDFLGMSMDVFGEDHKAFGRALDYRAFAVPFLAAMDEAGELWEPRINKQLMGIAMGKVTPDLSITIKAALGCGADPDDRDFTIYVPLDDDPPAAAARTLDELAAFRVKLASRRAEVRNAVPRIERSAVVALAAGAASAEEVMARLATGSPLVIPEHPPIGAQRMPGPKDGIKVLPSRSSSSDDGPKATRTVDLVRAETPHPFQWKGNTLTIKAGKTLPDSVMCASAGKRVDEVIDDHRMNGAGLFIDRIKAIGKSGTTLRIHMRSDPLSKEDARALAGQLVDGARKAAED